MFKVHLIFYLLSWKVSIILQLTCEISYRDDNIYAILSIGMYDIKNSLIWIKLQYPLLRIDLIGNFTRNLLKYKQNMIIMQTDILSPKNTAICSIMFAKEMFVYKITESKFLKVWSALHAKCFVLLHVWYVSTK